MKKILFLLGLLLLACLIPLKTRAYDVDTDLILRLSFNDLGSTIVRDSSGNDYHGFYDVGSGSQYWDSSSINAEALTCIDFNASEDQFVNITDRDAFSFTDGAGTDNAFSVDFWFNLDDTASFHWLFAKTYSATEEYSCGVDANGRLVINLIESIFDSIWVRTANGVIVAGNWYHFAFRYNGNESNTGMEIFLNNSNVVDSRGGSGYDGMANTNADLYIGRVGAGTATDTDGKIDEFRLWNIALSNSEIQDLFNLAPDLESPITTTETALAEDVDYPRVILTPSGLTDIELILIVGVAVLTTILGLLIMRRMSKK